jgi:predicted ATP-grasp superfamily ATP-dependent carboligase
VGDNKPVINQERTAMTVDELCKKASLYEISKLLKISAPATYKWKKTNKIPAKRLKQLMLLKPDWFA